MLLVCQDLITYLAALMSSSDGETLAGFTNVFVLLSTLSKGCTLQTIRPFKDYLTIKKCIYMFYIIKQNATHPLNTDL